VLEIRRSSNLRILSAASATLRVDVRAFDLDKDEPRRILAFVRVVKIEILEAIRVERNGFVEAAPTWQSYVSLGWGSDLSGTSAAIDRALTQFLNEYLAANPRVQ
jgi:hypothetical protein